MRELFDTAGFSSKNQIGGSIDSAWDDGSAFSELSSLEWAVGDRIAAIGDDNQAQSAVFSTRRCAMGSPQEEQLCKRAQSLGKVTDVNKKIITITWENGLSAKYTPKQIQDYGYQKFLEEKEAIAKCSNTPVSSQVSEVLNSELTPPEHQTSSKQNSSSKITATLKQYSITDSQTSLFTATSRTITQSLENLTSTQSASLAPAPALQATEPDLTTQNQNSGLKHCGASQTVAPVSSSLKILQDLSTKDYEQFLGDSEWLATSGMIRKSYQLRNSDRPKKGKGFSSLPTPTTYAKGSTGCRPAGATRLEQKLRPYINKGDKLNPAVPGWMMGFPVGWVEWPLMDTGETISVQLPFIPEYATTSINGEIVTIYTPGQSAPSKQQLQLSESVISPISSVNRANTQPETYIINQSELLGIIEDNLGFGFVVNWLSSSEQSAKSAGGSIPPVNFVRITYNWERDNQIIAELAIAPQHLIDKLLEEKAGYQIVPENFLEETERAAASTKKPKRRQRKGCLYKYLENKKLKDGKIASYPRVTGHRNPDNPTHWRWGFNWEEKIDGEWKGRSIGSVPLGAIALIQSMQNEGVPLEEIIGFIKRAKAKK
jgi:hypothetical protein